ncbi:MAG TPA: carotenoid biosynthesis protein [Candidatus Acidoferrum sp.]|nr:carotenoid biosynthesis protein [Candidatus Acidoferrum sp.]
MAIARQDLAIHLFLQAMLLLYVLGRLLQLYSGVIPTLTIVLFQVLPPAAFALLHGILTYRLRGILFFFGACLGTGAFFESLSLRTGFPFGYYYFTDVMGPKLYQLPVLLVLAYVGMGYLCWSLVVIILARTSRRSSLSNVLALPLLAAFIMVAWDFSMDPFWSTVGHTWIWNNGGAYFGVPISNFLGWYLTAYIFYQLFALYLCNRDILPQRARHWRLPILFYVACTFGNLLLAIPTQTAIQFPAVVTDPSGQAWMVKSIIGGCVLSSLFVMGPFALLAWIRLTDQQEC